MRLTDAVDRPAADAAEGVNSNFQPCSGASKSTVYVASWVGASTCRENLGHKWRDTHLNLPMTMMAALLCRNNKAIVDVKLSSGPVLTPGESL